MLSKMESLRLRVSPHIIKPIMEAAEHRQALNRKVLKGMLLAAFGLVFLGWLWNTPAGLLGKADAIGYAVCHRIELRSFFIGERQMPLCARCSGMYLGAMLGLLYQRAIGSRRRGSPPWYVILTASVLVLTFILDGLNSFFSFIPTAPHLYQPNNTLRLISGTGMGLAIAIALFPAFNASVWRITDPGSSIDTWRKLAGMSLLAVALDVLILLDNPLILYLLALVSAFGVLILLTLVYLMMGLLITRKENRYNRLIELLFPMLAGLTMALIQIGLLDLVRYAFTGSWEGFHLG